MSRENVCWGAYALQYDMLLEYNPFYQALFQEVLAETETWEVAPGDTILDLGAGTGNYSSVLAARFPQATVIHADSDVGMNAMAQQKKVKSQLKNLDIVNVRAEVLDMAPGTLSACLAIHALYAFENPQAMVARLRHWLKPGGKAILVDPGRVVKVLEWQWAIGSRMVRQHGLKKTINILKEGREVSRQNRAIGRLQANGIYWTHSHQEFCDTVSAAGFVIEKARPTFRGVSDMVVVRA